MSHFHRSSLCLMFLGLAMIIVFPKSVASWVMLAAGMSLFMAG